MNFDKFRELMYVDENYADFLQPFLTFIISRITDNHIWLLLCFGIIFGYFYSRNVWFIIERLEGKLDNRIIFLLAIFSVVIPIWFMNGFRFWTATHIFFFALIRIFLEKKKIYLLLILLTVFVHFSFILPISLTLLYFIFGRRLKIYFYFFIISLFITEINVGAVSSTIQGFLPEIFVQRSEGYIARGDSEDASQQNVYKDTTDNRNWYAIYYLKVLNWAVTANLIFIFYNCKKVYENDEELHSLLSFIFYFFALANIISLVPSGRRFISVSNLIAMALIVLFIKKLPEQKKYNIIFRATLPLFLLYGVVTFKEAFNSLGLTTVAGNPIIALLMDENVALIDI